jgi:hypothetical protein
MNTGCNNSFSLRSVNMVGSVGQEIPHHQREIFQIVRDAHNAAVDFVHMRVSHGDFPYGWEADEACRQ